MIASFGLFYNFYDSLLTGFIHNLTFAIKKRKNCPIIGKIVPIIGKTKKSKVFKKSLL